MVKNVDWIVVVKKHIDQMKEYWAQNLNLSLFCSVLFDYWVLIQIVENVLIDSQLKCSSGEKYTPNDHIRDRYGSNESEKYWFKLLKLF